MIEKILAERSQPVQGDGETYDFFMEVIVDHSRSSRKIYDGFISKPLSLENSAGKMALNALLDLCYFVVKKELLGKGLTMDICTVGTGKNYEGNCKLRMYQLITECTDADAMSYLSKEQPWPDRTKVYKQCNIPDVQVRITNARQEKSYPITGEITNEISGQKYNQAIEETYKQALVGLQHRDTSYGILLNPFQGTIQRLQIKEPSLQEAQRGKYRYLILGEKSWSFGVSAYRPFDIDQFIEFTKAIIGIMLSL